MRHAACSGRISSRRHGPMLDIAFLILGLGSFALLAAYAYGCNRL
jgi:hypothetical protein